jgi:alpha 1,6-mannosyltransferase
MKSDLLRYLILHAEGGVNADMNTITLKVIETWVPEELQDQVDLIVVIEFNRLDGDAWADIPQ